MNQSLNQIGLAVLILLLSLFAQSAMAARLYVYQLPDGSRLISDHAINKPTHKLITSRTKVEGTGQIAAKKNSSRTITYNKPKHVDRWDDLINELSSRYKVDVALVKAVIHTESFFDYRATSHAGASGLMQLMPQTAAKYGVHDIDNPYENLDAGIQHLRYLLTKYRSNLRYALAAYNAGEKAVYYYNGIPPYKETREYVQKVLAYRDYYKQVY
jgi:soluble lytic murein transglycosylase-like protein